MPLVLVAGVALGLATCAGFFGGAWWVLDLFASIRPQLAAGLILCSVLLALGRWKRSSAMIGLLAVVNLAIIAPLFVGPPRPDTAQLRVVSYNILGSNKHFDEVVDFIRASGADVVVLHEVTRRWEGVIEEASLTDGDWPYEVTRSRAAGDLFGTLVLAPTGSRVTSFGFGVTDPRAIEISLPEGIKMLAIHPLSPYTRFRASQNDQQLQFAANWARRQHGPTVVFGDFNSTPWSYPFRRLVAETGLRNSEHGFGLDLSYPADRNPFLRIPIDHLLHSADLATVDRHLGPALGSDHFPLTVDLAMVAQ